ncbi:DUF5999 family protein [Streptomyces sp. NPDC050743]|uniref:DUF5999 family protein n=1 Tax=Streptomyces sp. NPDC050743 TaxID=3365634 RepID=UPI0037B6C424
MNLVCGVSHMPILPKHLHSRHPHFHQLWFQPEARTTHQGEVQRRSLLCNGVLLFEDTGELLPDGRVIAPHRPVAALA